MENHGYTSPEKNHAINFEEVQKERKQTVPNVGSTTDGNQYLHHQNYITLKS